MVARILDELGAAPPLGRVLDVPCGSGRLSPVLLERSERVVSLDVSAEMLAALERRRDGRVRALVEGLPFRDDSFDAVVCCRLLHHLGPAADLERATSELLRVSRGIVVASFWDSNALPSWRRRIGWRTRRSARIARARPVIAYLFERAGGEVIAYRQGLRYVSQQTFVVVRNRARSAGQEPGSGDT